MLMCSRGHYLCLGRDCFLSVRTEDVAFDPFHSWSDRAADQADYAERLVQKLKPGLKYYDGNANASTTGVVIINNGAVKPCEYVQQDVNLPPAKPTMAGSERARHQHGETRR
jgi:hypothetical protein